MDGQGREPAERREADTSSAGLLRGLGRRLAAGPFRPHPCLRGGHAQTLAGWAWPRRFGARPPDEARLFEVEPGVRVLARCRWHPEPRTRATLVLVHGLGGSADAPYMVGAARLAFRAGANVVRLNQRNCGGTEHLTPTLYHSGMSGDLAFVVRELLSGGLPRVVAAGFSMGGNLALKMAGEMGAGAPPGLLGVCAVSPVLDLAETSANLDRPSNIAYRRRFVANLRRLALQKKRLYPNLYDVRGIRGLRTVRDFDERFTAPHGGFADADDYYARCSSIGLVPRIKVPTLVVHARDDPLVPFAPLQRSGAAENPNVLTATPEYGGHVGFVSDDRRARFWAEETLAAFCSHLSRVAEARQHTARPSATRTRRDVLPFPHQRGGRDREEGGR